MDDAAQSPTVRGLVLAHYQDVYRFAYRLSGSAADAEDLTQQTFLIACRKLSQLRSAEKSRSWLFTIVRHAYLRDRQSTCQELPAEWIASAADPERPVPEEFDEERLQAALQALPDAYRAAVLMYYFDELSYREIAELTETPIGTVMSRLARGKQLLRNHLVASTPVPAPT